jgi:prepilin-type processing-associated H-X9-DG protein
MTENEKSAEMPSSQNNVTDKMTDKKKPHLLSTVSLFFAIAGITFIVIELFFIKFLLLVYLPPLLFFISLICGIIAITKIKEARRALVGLFVSGLALAIGLLAIGNVRAYVYRWICSTNLCDLGRAIHTYASDNNDVLPSQRWCDDLKNAEVMPETFICKASFTTKGQSSYAFNKNLIGRKLSAIDSNSVMVFETFHGWNQVGGLEILSIQNHDGKGCNIVFVDGHVEFVSTKDIPNLCWEP